MDANEIVVREPEAQRRPSGFPTYGGRCPQRTTVSTFTRLAFGAAF